MPTARAYKEDELGRLDTCGALLQPRRSGQAWHGTTSMGAMLSPRCRRGLRLDPHSIAGSVTTLWKSFGFTAPVTAHTRSLSLSKPSGLGLAWARSVVRTRGMT